MRYLIILLPLVAQANEPFDASPTNIVLSGHGVVGDPYSISIEVEKKSERYRVTEMTIQFRGVRSDIPARALRRIRDPRFDLVQVINDTGVLGNSLTVILPYGEEIECDQSDRRGRMALIRFGDGSLVLSDPCADGGRSL